MRWLSLFIIFSCVCPLAVSIAKEEKAKKAKWSVSGHGLLKNRNLKQQLNAIFGKENTEFEAADIEDAALILLSSLQAEGYLEAKAEAQIDLVDGASRTVEWDSDFGVFLPRDTLAKRVAFKLLPGPISYYENLVIDNESELEEEEIVAFFYVEGLLFQSEKSRVFTPGRMNSAAGNLQSYLNQLGFQKAKVETSFVESEAPGSKIVRAKIAAGKLHRLTDIAINVVSGEFVPDVDVSAFKGQPFSRFLSQDITRLLRNRYYESGYPQVAIKPAAIFDESGSGEVSLKLDIDTGPGLTVGEVSFSGLSHTRDRLVESRVELVSGEPLNPIALEESRLNIARLGVFGKVDYVLSDVDESIRDLEFVIDERTPWDFDVLLGWGSYEALRGGVSAEKINVFGLGHRLRFQALASLKSNFVEGRYSVPQLWGTRTSLSSKVYALDREEESFDRREIGFDLGLSRYLERLDINSDVVYTFESLESRNSTLGDSAAVEDDTLVGSIGMRLGRDRRDNPINPRSGYRAFAKLEWASEVLGGETDYQLAELGYSMHGAIGKGLYWHGALTHGVVGSLYESESQVPASKLYYLGGENSIRGYQRGEAAPVDAVGKFVGARSYLLLNLELEQMLTDSLSVVIFLDSLGQSPDFGENPFDQDLQSAGLGLRLKTFMGPIRFEYGRNLSPRPSDSDGTFHFSIGYPF